MNSTSDTPLDAIKVLIISPLPPPVGGIATWTQSILRHFNDSNRTKLLHLDTATKYRDIVNPILWKRVFIGGIGAMLLLAKLIRILAKEKPNVVHVCSNGELGLVRDILFLALANVTGKKTVLHLHRGNAIDYPDLKNSSRIQWILNKIGVKTAEHTIVLNTAAYQTLEPLANHISTIANPTKLAPKRQIPRVNCQNLLFVGHVNERKGIKILIEAVVRLFDSETDDRILTIVGPYNEDYLLGLGTTIGRYANRIRFTGAVDSAEVQNYMQDADALILPSYGEGLPYVIIEAMSSGLPTISTKVGGIPDALGGGAGLLIDSGSVDQLHDALKTIASQSVRDQLSTAAYTKATSNFAIESVAKKLDLLWRNSDATNSTCS